MRAFVISSVLLVFIWRPISAQTFTELSIPAGLTGGSYYATGQLVDIDNDGDMDVTLSASDHGLTIYYNNNLDFSSYVTFDNLKTERQFLSAIDLGDFNRDGKIDILSGGGPNYSGKGVILNHNPSFDINKQKNLGDISGPVQFGDFDRNGTLDVLQGMVYPSIYTNQGDSLASSFYQVQLQGSPQYGSYNWMDIDRDGKLELISNGGSYGTSTTYIFEVDSSKHIMKKTPITALGNGGTSGITFGDVDADGDFDMLVKWEQWQLFYNDKGNFTAGPLFPLGTTAKVADMNNDGRPDIIIAGVLPSWYNFEIEIFSHNADNTFTKVSSTGLPVFANLDRPDIDIADIDGDGDLDILSVLPNKIFLNNTVATNAPPAVPIDLVSTVNKGTVSFHWTGTPDDHTPIAGLMYNVEVQKQDGTIITPSHSLDDGTRQFTKIGNAYTNNFYTLGCLVEGSYSFKVQSLDGAYLGSEFTTAHPFSISGITPVAPTNVKATSISDHSVQLTWSDNTDNETMYVIQKRSDYDHKYYDYDTVAVNVTLYIDSIYLTPKTTYNYRVVAANCSYPSQYGATVTGKTFPKFFEESGNFPAVTTTTKLCLADYDNDGDQDALVTNMGNSQSLLLNNNEGLFEDSNITIPYIDYNQEAEWVDVNNDGYLDIAITNESAQDVHVLMNNRGTGFVDKDLNISFSQTTTNNIVSGWGDFDQDGDLDLLISGYRYESSSDQIALFQNNGKFVFKQVESLSGPYHISHQPWGDYDNDGDLDILAFSGGSCGSKVTIIETTNDSTFVMKPTMLDGITNNSFYVGEARWVDINSDGYLDIFMAGLSGCDSYTGLTSLLLNDKHGFFDIGLAGLRLPAFHEYVDISFGDLDLDGTPDLTVYGATQGYGSRFFTFFYQNNNFRDSKIDYIISGDDDNNIDLGDVDNDGDLDLAVNGERRTPPYNNEEVVYRNNIVGSWGKTNNSPSVPTNLQIQQSGNDLVLSWSPSNDDHTPVKSITYEAFVMLGNDTITSSNSNLGDGTRKISLVGNLGNRTTQTFKIHKNGTVRWGVQAIDGSYRASAFAMSPDFEATGINDNNDEGDGDGDGDGDEGDGDDGEVTGLKDEQISIDVYPNPAKQNIYVRGGVDVPQVYNVVGQQLDLPVNRNTDIFEINTSSVNRGVYIVRIQTAGKKWIMRKVIVE